MEKPIIFSKFESEIKGKTRKFWVQLLPDDYKEIAIELYCKYFLEDEPICKSMKITEDEESLKYCKNFWWDVVNKNAVLACFTELDDGQIQLVAANMCYPASTNDEKYPDGAPERVIPVLETLNYINSLKSISKELGTTEYLAAFGLLVIPEYRGHNIGLHVLNARRDVCKKLGLKATVTFFSSPAAQRLAEKAGFKDLLSLTYDDLEKMRPASKFPNINEDSKRFRNMYIVY